MYITSTESAVAEEATRQGKVSGQETNGDYVTLGALSPSSGVSPVVLVPSPLAVALTLAPSP